MEARRSPRTSSPTSSPRSSQTAFPGVVFNFSQYINDNVEEALSGVKGENSVKVLGPDLETNEKNGDAIVDVMSDVPGVKDLGMFHTLGQPSVKIIPDRGACARYGLNTGDVEAVVQAAIGGQAVTKVYEGEKFFELTVRWQEQYRQSLEAIREITVATPDGNNIPLGQIASVTPVEGPAIIYREDGMRYVPVKFSVRGRDLKSTIEDAQQPDRGEDQAAVRHAPRVGGRDQRAQGRERAPRDHHPAHAAPHRVPRLQRRPDAGSTRSSSSCRSRSPAPGACSRSCSRA